MNPTVVAVIPIRYADVCSGDGTPLFRLSGRTLWDITIAQAVAASGLASVVVAYDDDRFLPALEPWQGKVVALKRPAELSFAPYTTMDVLAFAARSLGAQGQSPDFVMLLEITHPLRPKGIIDQVAAVPANGAVDSVVTCHPQHYNFWRREINGAMKRIAGPAEIDGVAMYQELTGICSLFSPNWLGTETPFGELVDVVPIARFWATIDVRDEDGLWLAQSYLERTGAEP